MLQIALMEREILAASSTPDHDRAPKFSFTLFMLLSQPFARSFIPNVEEVQGFGREGTAVLHPYFT